MRKLLLFVGAISMMLPTVAQATIEIEIMELSQDCDTVQGIFIITDSSESTEGMVLLEIKNPIDSTIAGNIMFYHPPLIEHVYTMYAPLSNQPFGSHIGKITAYNTDGWQGINNIKDIDLVICIIGIENAQPVWCNARIFSGNLQIDMNNENAAMISIFDMHGKMVISETKIFGTTLLPLDVPVGIYSLIVQQDNATKVFKLTATDW